MKRETISRVEARLQLTKIIRDITQNHINIKLYYPANLIDYIYRFIPITYDITQTADYQNYKTIVHIIRQSNSIENKNFSDMFPHFSTCCDKIA